MTTQHVSQRSIGIIAVEQGCILTSLAMAIGLDLSGLQQEHLIPQIAAAVLLYIGASYYTDLYNFSQLDLRRELLAAAVRWFSTLALVFGTAFLCTSWFTFHPVVVLAHLLLSAAFVALVRPRIDGLLARHGIVIKVAIVGTGQEARRLAEEITRHRERGQEVCCFVGSEADAGTMSFRTPNPGVRTLPVIAPATLHEFAAKERIRRILVATADVGDALPVDDLLRCKAEGYEVLDGHTFSERTLGRISVEDLAPEWLIFAEGFTRSTGIQAAKRAVDVVAASGILILTAPLCLLLALFITIGDRGPVLYRQTRVGRGSTPFQLFKLRSMRVDAEADTGPVWAQSGDSRITRVGRWLRALRIDEIPQAWNVLRGDMSFVGPRPERPEFVAQLRASIPYYDYRHAVRPGITGWAQVNLPYTATVADSQQKLEYDLYYLKNFSIILDVIILVKTVKIILFGWGSR